MIDPSQLDNPFLLARALMPLCRSYLSEVKALPGRHRGFRFKGHRSEIELAGKSRYQLIRELDAGDPLRTPLLRWVHRLTEMRVNQLWLDEDERLSKVVQHVVREPVEIKVSMSEMKKGALSSEGEEAKLWWHNVELNGASLSAHRVGYLHRCAEFHARLGEVDPLGYFSASKSSTRATQILESSWSATRELLADSGVEDFPALIALGKGSSLGDGWPARLAPDALLRLFSAPELFRGIDLKPGPLPLRLVPASFLRAAYQIGRALNLAWAPQDRPFVLMRDPDDFWGHRLGYLFVLWMLSPAFDERALGLGRAAEKERRRGRGQLLLALSTLQSCRALLFEIGMDHQAGRGELEEALLEHLHLSASRPELSALSWMSVRRDEVTRLFALFDAALLYQELVEEFDLDWWRNEKALEKLRADHLDSASIAITDERLRAGQKLLQEQLRDAVS
jgi:hypothetical protein